MVVFGFKTLLFNSGSIIVVFPVSFQIVGGGKMNIKPGRTRGNNRLPPVMYPGFQEQEFPLLEPMYNTVLNNLHPAFVKVDQHVFIKHPVLMDKVRFGSNRTCNAEKGKLV